MYYLSSEGWELGLCQGGKEEGGDNEGGKAGWGPGSPLVGFQE